jgi:MoxR-like ATPase
MTRPSSETAQELDRLLEKAAALRVEIAKVVVGQKSVIEELLVTLFAGGHALLVGVPGLAKTVLVKTVAAATHLSFKRIQFTPDLLPSDITGSEILQGSDDGNGGKSFRFLPGPIFTNLLLADEINRTAPKTQAALLEAMQEGQVTAGGTGHLLPSPFCVLATQNPIEQEGTYPLPEAQLDRFLLQINVAYPSLEDEVAMLKRTTGEEPAAVTPVLSAKDILVLRQLVREVPVAPEVFDYAARLARATRPGEGRPKGLEDFSRFIDWGAGPRAGQALILAAKALALLSGRFAASRDDVARLAGPVFRHRLVLSYAADAEKLTADDAVARLLAAVPRN